MDGVGGRFRLPGVLQPAGLTAGLYSFLKSSSDFLSVSIVTELDLISFTAAMIWPSEGFPSSFNGMLFRSSDANFGRKSSLDSRRIIVAQMSSKFFSLFSSFLRLEHDSPIASYNFFFSLKTYWSSE